MIMRSGVRVVVGLGRVSAVQHGLKRVVVVVVVGRRGEVELGRVEVVGLLAESIGVDVVRGVDEMVEDERDVVQHIRLIDSQGREQHVLPKRFRWSGEARAIEQDACGRDLTSLEDGAAKVQVSLVRGMERWVDQGAQHERLRGADEEVLLVFVEVDVKELALPGLPQGRRESLLDGRDGQDTTIHLAAYEVA